MSDQKAQIIGELQRKGKRITGQRKILLDVILEEMGFLSRGYRYSYPVEDKIS